VVGRDYRLSNFWLAKEVNKELKKEVAASVFIKNIKYYENTNCTLKNGKKNLHKTHKTTKIHILQYQTLTCTCTVDLYS
jgi:hypothetical protein